MSRDWTADPGLLVDLAHVPADHVGVWVTELTARVRLPEGDGASVVVLIACELVSGCDESSEVLFSLRISSARL